MTERDSAAAPLLVLKKITAILSAFSLARPELGLADIRASTGIPHSTVQRLVANMVQEGLLDRHGDRYRVGLKVAHWAAPATQGIDYLELITPVLRRLRDQLTETVCLFRASEGRRVCVAVAQTQHLLRRAVEVGSIMPLHVGSAGRVILAWSPEVAQEVYSAGLDAITDQTITSPDALRQAVAQTRADGYAITTGERVTSASGLSAPVFGPQAELFGALSVMGPTVRMPREVCESWVEPLLAAAEEATRLLGGRIPAAA
ncbi:MULTISPECIES: IclR family transcriptional regulator [Sinomonas]|jgi:DNA-binding IclR family transcriptional regulator|uniref:IclR family transcriptional regulator n=1 Tax=Sinomonas flava TaxID=496857 RepID=A0ABP5NUD1_9MICC|nr:IclR family transcriptional regulator [Sinomonas sp. R1AF57]ASN53140.1 IclR family transcriptional regulator [Sinomonas sp. R1AF57]